MGIDLANVSISLDRFNEVASGKYNIGQLKLSEDGTSVYRTNNHKTWTIFNNTKISAEESLAVKNAFCKALADEGLSADDIANIKKKLGIASVNFSIFRSPNLKPLSAVEVREIIDEYAGKINEKRAAKAGSVALKTSADFYKGVSSETLQSRAETRDAINESTLDKGIDTPASKMFTTLVDVVNYLEPGAHHEPSSEMTALAKEVRIALKRTRDVLPKAGDSITLKNLPISLVRGNDDKISIKLLLDDGNAISFATNLDKQGLHIAMGNIEARQYALAGETQKTESGNAAAKQKKPLTMAELSQNINKAFEVFSNAEKFNKLVKHEMAKDPRFEMLQDSDEPEDVIKKKLEHLEIITRSNLRSSGTDNIIENLQPALKKAGIDIDNRFKILSTTRSIIEGGPIPEGQRNALRSVIESIINGKPIPEGDKKAAGLEDLVDPAGKKPEVSDNLNENLNIGAFL